MVSRIADTRNFVPIQLPSNHARILQAALQQWSRDDLITDSQAEILQSTIQIQEESFDWQNFAKYTFRLALICLFIAVTSILADNAFRKLIRSFLALPAWLRSAATAIGATAVHRWGYNRSFNAPTQVWTNESIHGLGALCFGLAAFQLAEWLDAREAKNFDRLNWVLLLLAGIYGATGLLTGSNFIYSCGMVVLGGWFGAMTGYISGWGAYYFGMNYPIRFVLFGLSIIGTAYLMRLSSYTAVLWSTTRTWGLIYLFVALWILSIFGNDGLFDKEGSGRSAWRGSPGNVRLLVWSLAFGLAAVAAILHGLEYRDSVTKGFGLTFLGINLYTKYFEVFWNRWYKPLFFVGLAGTLACLVGDSDAYGWSLAIASLNGRI
ncbi:integral membrane protein [Xylariales sp. PMI_506]|nr:integral membrane protein [Xylariales sp. PMI_506]